MRLNCCLLALLAACAGSNPSPISSAAPQTLSVQNAGSVTLSRNDGPNELSVPLTVAQVWAVLPAVYDSLGIQLTTVDGRTHLIGNAGFKARQRLGSARLSKYFECGQTQIGPNADSYDMYLVVMTEVRAAPNGGGSTLVTTNEASAKPIAFSQDYSRCSSQGTLEPRIRDLVMSLAAPAKKP